tara:strand:- start:552 stop:803 length:252 start_codon:yes stop_codon:yes gene_type:complete
MVRFRGGIIGLIVGLLIETLLFFIGHVCQIFFGVSSNICPMFIIPFSLVADVLFFSVRINYLISLGIFLVICFVLGSVILRKY